MDQNGNSRDSRPPKIEGRKKRDDTPSFIRNARPRASVLNPQSRESLPVLTVPRSIKIWRKVRWPIFVFLVVVLLTAVGLFTNDRLVERSVSRSIFESQTLESLGTVDYIRAGGKMLSLLAERHPGRAKVQYSYAWHLVLEAELMGIEPGAVNKIKNALDAAGRGDDSINCAARAGLLYLEGKYDKAAALAKVKLRQFPNEPRIKLVLAWALGSLRKNKEAIEVVKEAILSSPRYVPLLVAGVELAIGTGERELARELTYALLSISPGHLYGSLAAIAVALPEWGEDEPGSETSKRLASDMAALKSMASSAPPKIASFGTYVAGRVYLLSERFEEAMKSLQSASSLNPNPEIFAWYARAFLKVNGSVATLALLDKKRELSDPRIVDLRTRCLLDLHRVVAAADAIKRLEAAGAKPDWMGDLRWGVAVRSGDLKEARKLMPVKIGLKQRNFAIDMYYLLQTAGDRQGVDELISAMDQEMPSCAGAIRGWYDADVRSSVRSLDDSKGELDPCVDVLASRLMRGHIDRTMLKSAADRAAAAVGENLQLFVDRAMATWFVDGKEAAVKALDEIADLKPEGVPILQALSGAYLDLNMPDKALAMISGKEDPESTALRIFALRKAKKDAEAAALAQTAAARAKEDPHPALVYFDLEAKLEGSFFDEVIGAMETVLPDAGRWTAEIAELGANAINTTGDRPAADRLLVDAAKKALENQGQGESWEAKAAQVRLNLRRGGSYNYKALEILTQLEAEGSRDPEFSYDYAVIHSREGNVRGAIRYLKDTLALNPAFERAYRQLLIIDKFSEEVEKDMASVLPDLKF